MFLFRLAGHLGRTVDELRDLSTDEYFEWIAFDQLSPIGGERLDTLHAMLSTLLANCHSKKRFKLKDFLPKWGGDSKAKDMPPDALRAWFLSLKANAQQRARKLDEHKQRIADEGKNHGQ